MTPEEQRITILEECGWTHLRPSTLIGCGLVGRPPNGDQDSTCGAPDLLNDLNAMHEAVGVLDAKQQLTFGNLLIEVADRGAENRVDTFHIVNATAAQRAEAFLRTIGKWRD